MKKFIEAKNTKIEAMEAILTAVKAETRAFTVEENTTYEALKADVAQLDKTIKAIEESRTFEKQEDTKDNDTVTVETRAFANYIRGVVTESRAETLNPSANGVIIPTTIASKIIELVKELSPIYAMATVYNVGGNLSFPVWGNNGSENISCAYASEFTDLTSTSGKFTSVELKGFLAGALTKVSKSLINNSDFDLVNFVVRKVSEAIAEFLEKELINGTTDKMTGILSATSAVTTASSTAITSDEIIDLEMSIPQVYATNACFIMNKATFKAIRKLKNVVDGDYLLNKDITKQFGWELLGHTVYISENMPTVAAGAKAIVYGDMSGLYIKLANSVELQILQETFAAQHALGVVGWVEADSKIVETQKIRVLTMKAA